MLRPNINKIYRQLLLSLVIAMLLCLTLTANAVAVATTALYDTGITLGRYIVLPSASTSDATQVEESTATLHGAVTNDGGDHCQCRFTYGTVSGNYTLNTSWTGSLTTGQTFSVNVTGLGKGTKYYFRAQVKNCVGIGSSPELNFLTKPEALTSLSATVISDTRIDLNWIKGEGAQRTLIVRKTGGFPADRNDGTQVYFGTGTSFSDTGLTPNTTYYYRAWSQVSGSEQWSDAYREVTATTAMAPPPTTTPPIAVGGVVYPVNKAQVLAPWLVACSIIILVAGGYIIRITLTNNKGKSRGG